MQESGCIQLALVIGVAVLPELPEQDIYVLLAQWNVNSETSLPVFFILAGLAL